MISISHVNTCYGCWIILRWYPSVSESPALFSSLRRNGKMSKARASNVQRGFIARNGRWKELNQSLGKRGSKSWATHGNTVSLCFSVIFPDHFAITWKIKILSFFILTPKSPSKPLSWIRSRPFLCSSHFSVQTECDSKPYSLLFTGRCDRRIYHTAGGWVDLFCTLHAAAWKTRSVPFAMFYWF